MLFITVSKNITFFFSFEGFGHAAQHVGSELPDQGLDPHPLQWTCKVLITGLQGMPTTTF